MSVSKVQKTTIAVALALAGLAGVTSANAALLFDRGLPTGNLNSPAGASRSNVAWADVEPTAAAVYLPGDDFTLAGAYSYNIDTIRIWTTNPTAGLSLLGGLAGGATSLLSTSYVASGGTYSGGALYETTSSGFLPVFQVDFAVNIALTGGQTFQFFLDGPATAAGGDFTKPTLHASNGPLSVSTQEGSDGVFLWYNPTTGTDETWQSGTGLGTAFPGYIGWDKNSDGNVQVLGTVPEPETVAMVLLGLMGFVARRKKQNAAA